MIYDVHSLKEKRAILQRVLTRVKQRYNVAVSEMGIKMYGNVQKLQLFPYPQMCCL